jgi:hypothetical protein
MIEEGKWVLGGDRSPSDPLVCGVHLTGETAAGSEIPPYLDAAGSLMIEEGKRVLGGDRSPSDPLVCEVHLTEETAAGSEIPPYLGAAGSLIIEEESGYWVGIDLRAIRGVWGAAHRGNGGGLGDPALP